MKKITAILAIFTLFCTLPFAGAAMAEEEFVEPTLTLQLPDKLIYFVGEAPDYTGGYADYRADFEYQYPLEIYSTGLDTSTPGNKTVTVSVHGLTAYFNVLVLRQDEPITTMTDISHKHWSYIYFGPCMKAGYFTGDDQNHVSPDAPITRAEMAQIIYRAWQTDPTVMDVAFADAAEPFPDVKEGDWFYEAVEACRKAGIIRGMDTGLCMPDAPITREDAVLMLMRIRYTDQELAAIDIEARIAESGVEPIDFRLVSDYARSAMAVALGDIIFGDNNKAIKPRSSITRAECATIFQRLFLKDYEWTPPEIPEDSEPSSMPLVYLSPSNQFTNSYAAGGTNEGAQMTILAEAVKALLEAEGYRVVLADRSTPIKQRAEDANAMGADLYIPIHSNAGGNTGTFVFYNGAIEGCKEFSREIFDRLAALTGTAYSANRHKEDYLSLLPNGAPFKEVMYPTMPLAYLEVEFHDKPDKALWIINNTDQLARAIADGVIAYSEKHLIK